MKNLFTALFFTAALGGAATTAQAQTSIQFAPRLGYGLGLVNFVPTDSDGTDTGSKSYHRVLQFSTNYFLGGKQNSRFKPKEPHWKLQTRFFWLKTAVCYAADKPAPTLLPISTASACATCR